MLCPQCQQSVQEAQLRGGACPYCGFPCAELERQVRVIQVLLSAFFVSTLIYGAVAAFLELIVGYRAPGAGGLSEQTLGIALLAGSAMVFVITLRVEGLTMQTPSVASYRLMAVLLAAMAEVPAICGLIMYLLVGSLPWMVAFLAISWALLIRLGLHLPRILHGITDCLRT